MSTIRCTGTTAEAARVLIEGSVLANAFATSMFNVEYGPGLTVVNASDAFVDVLSSGERLLWDALRAFSGPGAGIDIWACANRLDDANARALADAVSIALGAGVRA